MDPKLDILQRLPPRPLSRLLGDLAALRQRAAAGESVSVPLTTLHLRTGRDVVGWVVALDQAGWLLVHGAGPDPRQPGYDAVYLPLAAVEALTVHDAPAAAPFLSEGRLAAPEQPAPGLGPPPSRLELKRKLAEHTNALRAAVGSSLSVEVEWSGVAAEGEALRTLDRLIEDTVKVAMELAKDEMGRSALGRLTRLCFGEGSSPDVRLDGTAVLVVARLALGVAGRLGRSQLKEALERVL